MTGSSNTCLYPQHIPIFTDGSKQSNHTSTAVVLISHIITKPLPNSVSVYTAELYAILLALNELSKQQHKHLIYFFLTLYLASTLLVTKKLDHPITLQILLKYHNRFTHSFNIIFCLLPSHLGISGNEKLIKLPNQLIYLITTYSFNLCLLLLLLYFSFLSYLTPRINPYHILIFTIYFYLKGTI